eukprot:CAMPEP_0119367376 /NCGR_PEP_ID=MMETSP1334-20130426/14159_1 /TAXON_ID=127549 /ORGANISM="Calcidiscus leptoporus, Strain RCC1130" /LENGTH=98 /DNA_ID=CAMNT_0007383773 /DNA_START=344 /DNA_END=643 /DNA_ORIENTATION=-
MTPDNEACSYTIAVTAAASMTNPYITTTTETVTSTNTYSIKTVTACISTTVRLGLDPERTRRDGGKHKCTALSVCSGMQMRLRHEYAWLSRKNTSMTK